MTVDEFREAFVDAFPRSKNRPPLFDAWLRHREALKTLVPVTTQWIDGSYVSDKTEPGDIDVVTFLDGPRYDSLPTGTHHLARMLLAGPASKPMWGMDSYPITVYPEGHPGHGRYLGARGYWDWWLGRVRGDDSLVKGYVEVLP